MGRSSCRAQGDSSSIFLGPMNPERLIGLHDSEEIVEVVHQHPISHACRFVLFLCWLLIPFVLLYPLLQVSSIGIPAFLLFILSAALYGFLAFRQWDHTALILTTRRIIDIDQRGWRERIVTQIPLSRVIEVTHRTGGIFSALLRTGILTVRTSPRFPDIEFFFAPHPARLARRICERQDES